MNAKPRTTRNPQIAHRHYPKDIVADVKRLANELDRAMAIMRPIKQQEIEELKWQISNVEEMVTYYGQYMYDRGRSERTLFDE